jgi:hypothetical protein
MRCWSWLWSFMILAFTVAVVFVVETGVHMMLRSLLVMWFLLICPGMAVVRCFSFDKPVVVWTLAPAISIVIDALVASLLLYVGRWSPQTIFKILVGITVVGVGVSCVRWFVWGRRQECVDTGEV